MNWREGFARQANSDYLMLQRLLEMDGVERCHRLHYLQMASEKVSKAYICPPTGNDPPPAVHSTFLRFLRGEARQSPRLMRACRIRNKSQYRSYLKGLEDIAREIEKLAPRKNVFLPNSEYPWEGPDGVVAPADHHFPRMKENNPKFLKMLDFLSACLSTLP